MSRRSRRNPRSERVNLLNCATVCRAIKKSTPEVRFRLDKSIKTRICPEGTNIAVASVQDVVAVRSRSGKKRLVQQFVYGIIKNFCDVPFSAILTPQRGFMVISYGKA